MYNKLYRSNKGSTLVTVIIVIAVLAVLGSMLIETAVQGYRISKMEKITDYAYYAADSAVERWFDGINDVLTKNPDISDPYETEYDESDAAKLRIFTTKVLRDIKAKLNPYENIDISNDTKKATVVLKNIQSMEPEIPVGGKLRVKVGITADATYNDSIHKAVNKVVFVQKSIEIPIPNGFKLEGAIYSIGDFMIDGKTTPAASVAPAIIAKITGDVNVFGTFPEIVSQNEQNYYGGVYAKNSASLWVNGNVYSRSFIRTGESPGIDDGSIIKICRDAIAQGIHVFGDRDKLVVYRNAYTFDDLEMNGQDSVIAVNGSYIGLTRNDGSSGAGAQFHDNNSGVVSSAMIHNGSTDESKKSRIVINGDVMINGGSFKTNTTTGAVLGDLESASLSWIDDADSLMDNASYREYTGSFSGNQYHDLFLPSNYDPSNSSIGGGYSSLFQFFDPLPPKNSLDGTPNDGAIDTWLSQIDTVRDVGKNNDITGVTSVQSAVSGFSWYEMAANGRLYGVMNQKSINPTSPDYIQQLKFLKSTNTYDIGKYTIDNIKIPGVTDISKFWDDAANQTSWVNYRKYVSEDGYVDLSGTAHESLFKQLSDQLIGKIQTFATRSYPELTNASELTDTSKAKWNPGVNKKFETTLNKLNSLALAHSTSPYIITDTSFGTERNVTTLTGDTDGGRDDGKYYLIINNRPNIELVVNNKFNGIVYSAGKVKLENGADIYGAIVAAGKSYTNTFPYVSGVNSSYKDANYLPRLLKDGDNLTQMESGSYAGVYAYGNAGFVSNVSVDFFLGIPESTIQTAAAANNRSLAAQARVNLLNKFNNQGIDLDKIF